MLNSLFSELKLKEPNDFKNPHADEDIDISIVVRNLLELSMSQQVEIENLKQLMKKLLREFKEIILKKL